MGLRTRFKPLLYVCLAVIIGLASAEIALFITPLFFWQSNGAWSYNLRAGSGNATIYERAVVAKKALFALSNREAIYLFAEKTNSKDVLKGECTYVIRGVDINIPYWSITVYDQNNFLIKNHSNINSYNRFNTRYFNGSSFEIFMSPDDVGENWLPTKRAETTLLVLRLYQVSNEFLNNLNHAALPTIEKVSCE